MKGWSARRTLRAHAIGGRCKLSGGTEGKTVPCLIPCIWIVAFDGVDTVSPADKSAVLIHSAATGQLGEHSGSGLQTSATWSAICTTGIGMSISPDVLMNPRANTATKELNTRAWRRCWTMVILLGTLTPFGKKQIVEDVPRARFPLPGSQVRGPQVWLENGGRQNASSRAEHEDRRLDFRFFGAGPIRGNAGSQPAQI